MIVTTRHAALVAAALCTGPALADQAPAAVLQQVRTYENALATVSQDRDCKPSEQSNFVLFVCDKQKVLWYFTKPNHAAHPALVRRWLEAVQGKIVVREFGTFYGDASTRPAFEAWHRAILSLDKPLTHNDARPPSAP